MSDRALRLSKEWATRTRNHEEQVAVARENRDEAIRHAYKEEGATIADLARATHLSRTILYRILDPK